MSWNPAGEIKKWFNKVKHEAEDGIKRIKHEGDSAVSRVKHEAQTAAHQVEHAVDAAKQEVKAVELNVEQHLNELGQDIEDGLAKGFGELVELAESGVLQPALDKIADYAEHQIFDGSAPIPLHTAYVDIEITDAKLLARTIRDMIENGVPTSKSEWRRIIVSLAPKAITIKPGIPLIAQILNRIPLEHLEEEALDAALKKAGLN